MVNKQQYNDDADRTMLLFFKEGPDYGLPSEFHDSIEFLFITEGFVDCYLEGKCKRLTKNDIFFADSYEAHRYVKVTEETSSIVIVAAREYYSAFRQIYKSLTFNNFLTNKKANAPIIEFVKKWLESEDRTFLDNLGNMCLLFAQLAKVYPLKKRIDYQGYSSAKKILNYIHLHYRENISLKSIARALGYTPEHCSSVINKTTRSNFRKYINRLRYNHVQHLLADKSLSYTKTEALYAAGFESPATYYRVSKLFENKTKD